MTKAIYKRYNSSYQEQHPVKKYLLAGKSYKEIEELLGIKKASISYHAKALGLAGKLNNGKSYDWKEISDKLNSGMTYTEARKTYEFAKRSFEKALKTGKITDNRILTPRMNSLEYSKYIETVLSTPNIRKNIRKKLILDGKEEKCDHPNCNRTEWNGLKIPLEVDHIDGNSANNKLDNLRFLCLNCHSQTETWRGRNTKLQRQKRNIPD